MRRKLTALLNIFLVLLILMGSTAIAAPENYNAETPQLLSSDHLYAASAILIDADSGDILYSKNERVRMHPASTTKIMTLLLAVESGFPLEQQIAIPQAASNIASDSTLIPVFPGETMTFGDLLTGFMLNSGNDGANAVAVLVGGTIENFVAMMNQRAAQLGCIDTHFANAHGYTADEHYTTAYDLALITRAAMQHETVRDIVRRANARITVNERGEILVGNKHLMLKEDSPFYYEGAIGVKTGSTNAAGKCYVGAAEKDGATVISVVLKCTEDDQRWYDTEKLFDYGWTCYDAYTLDQMYDVASGQIASFVVSNAAEDDPYGGRLDLEIAQISNTSYLRMIQRSSPTALSDVVNDFIANTNVSITHDLTAPISMGEIIGDFSFFDTATGTTVTAKLVAGRDVAQRTVLTTLTDLFPFLNIFKNRVFLLLLGVLALLILLIIILVCSRHAASQRRRRRIYEQRRAEYMRRMRMQQEQGYDGSGRSSRSGRRPR